MTHTLSVICHIKYIIFDMSVITSAMEGEKAGLGYKKEKKEKTVPGVVASVREA